MSATPKQLSFLKSLLIQAGHAHPKFGLRQSGKEVCGVARSQMSWDGLAKALTARQASDLIAALKK